MRKGVEEALPLFGVGRLCELLREVQIVPTHETILDEPFTALGKLLFVLLSLEELARIADRHGASEAMRSRNLVELAFNCLAQWDVVNVAQEEEGFDDPAKRLERPIQRMLLGVR